MRRRLAWAAVERGRGWAAAQPEWSGQLKGIINGGKGLCATKLCRPGAGIEREP